MHIGIGGPWTHRDKGALDMHIGIGGPWTHREGGPWTCT